MKQRISWAVMILLSLMIITMGLEGSLGKVLGCLLTPAEVVINSDGSIPPVTTGPSNTTPNTPATWITDPTICRSYGYVWVNGQCIIPNRVAPGK